MNVFQRCFNRTCPSPCRLTIREHDNKSRSHCLLPSHLQKVNYTRFRGKMDPVYLSPHYGRPIKGKINIFVSNCNHQLMTFLVLTPQLHKHQGSKEMTKIKKIVQCTQTLQFVQHDSVYTDGEKRRVL